MQGQRWFHATCHCSMAPRWSGVTHTAVRSTEAVYQHQRLCTGRLVHACHLAINAMAFSSHITTSFVSALAAAAPPLHATSIPHQPKCGILLMPHALAGRRPRFNGSSFQDHQAPLSVSSSATSPRLSSLPLTAPPLSTEAAAAAPPQVLAQRHGRCHCPTPTPGAGLLDEGRFLWASVPKSPSPDSSGFMGSVAVTSGEPDEDRRHLGEQQLAPWVTGRELQPQLLASCPPSEADVLLPAGFEAPVKYLATAEAVSSLPHV